MGAGIIIIFFLLASINVFIFMVVVVLVEKVMELGVVGYWYRYCFINVVMVFWIFGCLFGLVYWKVYLGIVFCCKILFIWVFIIGIIRVFFVIFRVKYFLGFFFGLYRFWVVLKKRFMFIWVVEAVRGVFFLERLEVGVVFFIVIWVLICGFGLV